MSPMMWMNGAAVQKGICMRRRRELNYPHRDQHFSSAARKNSNWIMISDLYKWCIYLRVAAARRAATRWISLASISINWSDEERDLDPVACVHLPYIHFSSLLFNRLVSSAAWFCCFMGSGHYFYLFYNPFRGDIRASTWGFIEQERVRSWMRLCQGGGDKSEIRNI